MIDKIKAALFLIVLLCCLSSCELNPLSSERGAVLFLFPFLFWPLKVAVYAWYVQRALSSSSAGIWYCIGLAVARVVLGVLLGGAGFHLFLSLGVAGLVMLPIAVSAVAWRVIYSFVSVKCTEKSARSFVGYGMLLSLFLNMLVLLITGSIGFGC